MVGVPLCVYDAGIRRMRVVYMVNCHGRSSLYVSMMQVLGG